MYFRTVNISHDVHFQDGGLTRNNPFEIILTEITGCELQQNPIDFIMSLGTGTFPGSVRGADAVARYPKRLYDNYMAQLDGQIYWDGNAARRGKEIRNKCYRINPIFTGPEIALDDSAALENLQSMTQQQFVENPSLVRVVAEVRTALLCSCFYLQIEADPEYDASLSLYYCSCVILLRWQEDRAVCENFRQLLKNASFLLPQGRFPVKIPFQTKLSLNSLSQDFDIKLDMTDNKRGSISGMPVSVSCLLRLQGGLPQISKKRLLATVS
jgi:hypothetical protein